MIRHFIFPEPHTLFSRCFENYIENSSKTVRVRKEQRMNSFVGQKENSVQSKIRTVKFRQGIVYV